MMRKQTDDACVLTIAGTDPSGGAGIQADIKSISATGGYAVSVITAVVAQNTQGVQAIHTIPPAFIQSQLDSVFDDLDIKAVKIGMLHDRATIDVVASLLKQRRLSNVVLDPVMISKNGFPLLQSDVVEYLKEKLFSSADLITPNFHEAEKIMGTSIKDKKDMEFAAKKVGEQFNINVLIKGGHAQSEQSMDVLYLKEDRALHWFDTKRIHTKNTHGTGCSLSSAIASYLAQNHSLREAIGAAKQYLTSAIESGSTLKIGKGSGPVDHFYFLRNRINVI